MKYRVFASPSLVWSTALNELVCFALTVYHVASADLWNYFWFFCILVPLFPGIGMYLEFYNAFCITTMDESGVHNKYANWKWEELLEYKLNPIRLYRSMRPMKHLTSIICFGPSFKGSFLHVSRKNRAFISITAKNLKRMYLLSKGRSPAINELWHRYSETLHCDQIDV